MHCSFCCAAAVVLFTVSCSNDAPVPGRAAQANAAAAAVDVVQRPAAADPLSPSASDALHDDYLAVSRQITRWDGDEEKLKDARERVMAILAKDRSYAPAYVALARVEYASGYNKDGTYEPEALDRAAKFVNHALKLDSSNHEAHCTAAWIARYKGDFDVAEESLRKADELRPAHAAQKVVRASIATAENDPQRAVQLSREVIAESADEDHRADAYQYLIEAYLRGSHLQEADAAYQELLKLRSDSASVHGSYAWLLLARDDIDGAVREAEAAARIRKYDMGTAVLGAAYLAKAQQLWEANRIGESAGYVEKVGELASDNAEVSYALGQFYEGAAVRGRDPSMRKKALASYKRVLEISPRHMEAERAVARMERRVR